MADYKLRVVQLARMALSLVFCLKYKYKADSIFRLLFKNWGATFEKDDFEDEWELFV
ncbi:MAG: hypothetical protein ACTHK0_02890 [Ginsengibacter sp.]